MSRITVEIPYRKVKELIRKADQVDVFEDQPFMWDMWDPIDFGPDFTDKVWTIRTQKNWDIRRDMATLWYINLGTAHKQWLMKCNQIYSYNLETGQGDPPRKNFRDIDIRWGHYRESDEQYGKLTGDIMELVNFAKQRQEGA